MRPSESRDAHPNEYRYVYGVETVQANFECEICLDWQNETDQIEICSKCRRQILPQLQQSGWIRLIGFTTPEPQAEPEDTAPVAKAKRRNERRFSNVKNPEDGLTCHFCAAGCSTPVSSHGMVCGPCGAQQRPRKAPTRVSYKGLKGRDA